MNIFVQIKDWLRDKSEKILSTSAFLMVAALSFVGGALYQKDHTVTEQKLVITVPDYEAKKQSLSEESNAPSSLPSDTSIKPLVKGVVEEAPQANCPYVGSKNSDKYHLATCGIVKRIKLENRRCFATPQVAEASGYVAGCVQ